MARVPLFEGPLGDPDVIHVIRGVAVAHVYCRPADNTTGQTVPSQWTRIRLPAITGPAWVFSWWYCWASQDTTVVCLYDGGNIRQTTVANFDGVAIEYFVEGGSLWEVLSN